MDLSIKQVMGMQNRNEFAHHIFEPKETFEETDIQGNITLFNKFKTDTNRTEDHDSSSLSQVKCPNENKLEVDNDDLFSYSSFKKAMDLRTHNRTQLDDVRRTIFDDAEYFAKNYRYKLLPITLEPVDETVIRFEHNYSLMALNSESETEENFSRTMDYSQIKEKNYKRRRTKFGDGSDIDEEQVECDAFDTATNGFHSSPILQMEDEILTPEEEQNTSLNLEINNSVAVQPLDLSKAPLVQEKKTDIRLRESPSSTVESDEIAQPDSDKENVNSELKGIRVTITRPDEKENYQPCDLFLNDIARLVPKLIDKNCFEVDILDRTCDRHDEFRKHRLYYVISESTWRLFQETNERVILTNDQSLGQPIREAEEYERPSYLVFDQFSLAKCLADYCQEIGGCFEYTFVEEGKQEACLIEEDEEDVVDEEDEEDEEEMAERVIETKREIQKVDEKVVGEEKEIVVVSQKEPKEEEVEQESQECNGITDSVKTASEELTEKVERRRQNSSELEDILQKECTHPKEEKAKEEVVAPPEAEEKAPEKADETKQKPPDEVRETNNKEMETPEHISSETAVTKDKNNTKKQSKGTKRKMKPSIQRKPKITRTTLRLRSAPESETSQKSDKPVSRKGKREPIRTEEEPPNKLTKQAVPEETYRRTRSGKVLQEVKTNKPTAKKKENAGMKKGKKTESKGKGQKTTKVEVKKAEETRRSLRSHKTTQWKEKVQVWSKTKARKR